MSIGEVAEGDEAPFKPPGRAVVSIDARLACVGREIGIRRNVYPRWINQARMTREAAELEIAAMEAVYETLQLVKRATGAAKDETGAPRPTGPKPGPIAGTLDQ